MICGMLLADPIKMQRGATWGSDWHLPSSRRHRLRFDGAGGSKIIWLISCPIPWNRCGRWETMPAAGRSSWPGKLGAFFRSLSWECAAVKKNGNRTAPRWPGQPKLQLDAIVRLHWTSTINHVVFPHLHRSLLQAPCPVTSSTWQWTCTLLMWRA
jgi:hypothetical protein